MKIRHVGKLRRAGAAAVLATALAVSVTACNDDGGTPPPASAASESPSGDKGQEKDAGQDSSKTLPDTSKVVATLKSTDPGIEMVVYSVTRDDGGFLTVNGEVKNTSGDRYTIPVQWSGKETEVARTGRSFAAMTLVDAKERKRHYVLRDTDNRPLTTSNFSHAIKPGEGLLFFAQFPAPRRPPPGGPPVPRLPQRAD